MTTREEIMRFFRQDDFECFSDCDKQEIMMAIASSINQRMEDYINNAIDNWHIDEASE
jgi:hypothetical protein